MPIIYKPNGKAREYAALAANLYRGCPNSCQYCYVPAVVHKDRTLFHSPEYNQPRKDILKKLAADARKYHGCPDNVMMSFTCDPYPPIEEELEITREAIKILNGENIGVTILTKGGKLAERDFDILAKNKKNQFGVTLTCVFANQSIKWEPTASLPSERLISLQEAHNQGIYTYISFEPVLYPESVYCLIKATQDFVEFYKIGKLNYHPHSKTINWPEFRENVTEILTCLGKEFLIKRDLREAGGWNKTR